MQTAVHENGTQLTVDDKTKQNANAAKVSRKRKSSGISKQPARPHKRLTDEVLNFRVLDMQKKRELLHSKLVLLDARLETHELEQKFRATSANGV
jgi:hypothetical protein